MHVDFMAPGVLALVSTTTNQYDTASVDPNCGVPISQNNSRYACFNGTSAAAPHVTGVAALMYSKHVPVNGFPNQLATEDIEHILEKTATDITSTGVGYDLQSGFGRINANKALEFVSDPYYVKHFDYGGAGSQSTITLDYDFPSAVTFAGFEDIGIANGTTYPFVQRYKVEWTINETLPNGHSIIDWWALEAVKRKGGNGFGTGTYILYNESLTENLNVTINGNTVTGTASTYIYYVETAGGSTGWLPFSADQAKYAFSLHVEKDADAGLLENTNIDFFMYPNPTNSELNISHSLKGRIEVELIDASGRVVTKKEYQQGTENISVDVSSLESGMYYCRMTREDGMNVTKTFIKNN